MSPRALILKRTQPEAFILRAGCIRSRLLTRVFRTPLAFEALWKKNNPEIDLLSDTYARETSDYFAAQCGIDPKGQWAMLDTSFTNLCHLYYSPSEGKEAFVEKFEQYYNAVQTSHYLRQTGQMTVRIQASGSFSASLPLTVDIIKDVPLDKDAFQADFSAYWDEDASKNQLAYQLLNP